MADPEDDLKDLLNDNWDTDNTDGLKPVIDLIYNIKRSDFVTGKDYVLVFHVDHTPRIMNINATHKETRDLISADVRTMQSRAHAIKVRDEVKRIAENNTKQPTGSFHLLEEVRTMPKSDKSKGMWRWVIDYRFRNFAVARGG